MTDKYAKETVYKLQNCLNWWTSLFKCYNFKRINTNINYLFNFIFSDRQEYMCFFCKRIIESRITTWCTISGLVTLPTEETKPSCLDRGWRRKREEEGWWGKGESEGMEEGIRKREERGKRKEREKTRRKERGKEKEKILFWLNQWVKHFSKKREDPISD